MGQGASCNCIGKGDLENGSILVDKVHTIPVGDSLRRDTSTSIRRSLGKASWSKDDLYSTPKAFAGRSRTDSGIHLASFEDLNIPPRTGRSDSSTHASLSNPFAPTDESSVAAEAGNGIMGGTGETPANTARGGSPDEIVDLALAEAAHFMKESMALEAEAALAQALDKLGVLPHNQKGEFRQPSPAEIAASERLMQSQVFKLVQEAIASYDASIEMVFNDKFQLLYENEFGRFEIFMPSGNGVTWFDYRMTVYIDAPLAECAATSNEIELVPKAQAMVSEKPLDLTADDSSRGFVIASLTKMNVLFFKIELLLQNMRILDKRRGFMVETIRSEFDPMGQTIPDKPWRAVRPWVYTANAWLPRGGGRSGTMLTQVTRVDCTITVPQWVLSFVFRQVASSFMKDLRASGMKAVEEGSAWSQKITEDETGFYAALREVEWIAAGRNEVEGLPEREFFADRSWRLNPPPHDTRPPASR